MLSTYAIENGKVVTCEENNAHIFVFYDLDSDENALAKLRGFDIDAHSLRSAFDPEEIARIERFEEYSVLICKRPHVQDTASTQDSGTPFQVASLGLFLFKDKLIVINREEIPIADFQPPTTVPQTLADIALNLVQHSTLHFFEEYRAIQTQIRKIENTIFNSTTDKQLMELFEFEKNMIRYLNSLGSNNGLFERILNTPDILQLNKKQISFLKNMMIDSRQCYKQAEIASEIMAGLTDTAASLVNNKLSIMMKRLTVISLIFLPINAIAGIGGMSEFTTASEKLGLSMWTAYGFLALGMLALAFLTYFFIRKIDV